MKLVKEHINEKFTEESDPVEDLGIGIKHLIEKWLEQYQIFNYIINDDMTIDVIDKYCSLNSKGLIEFPDYIQFRKIDGSFNLCNNKLITLKGCPFYVKERFYCNENELTSLKYSPKVCNEFICWKNKTEFTYVDVLKYCKVKSKIYDEHGGYDIITKKYILKY